MLLFGSLFYNITKKHDFIVVGKNNIQHNMIIDDR